MRTTRISNKINKTHETQAGAGVRFSTASQEQFSIPAVKNKSIQEQITTYYSLKAAAIYRTR